MGLIAFYSKLFSEQFLKNQDSSVKDPFQEFSRVNHFFWNTENKHNIYNKQWILKVFEYDCLKNKDYNSTVFLRVPTLST